MSEVCNFKNSGVRKVNTVIRYNALVSWYIFIIKIKIVRQH